MIAIFKCSRAAVFYNTGRLTPAQIKAQTGATHVINGWVFNSDFFPLAWTVIDSDIISRDQYLDWGFGCGDGAPEMTTDRSRSFLSGVPLLKNGKKLQRNLTPDVARRAERTAVGWLADGRVVLWCSTEKLVRDELQDKLLALGCVDGLMFDGGGSVQGDFPDWQLTSGRKVPTLLLFWEETDPEEEKPMSKKVCLDAGHDAGNKANVSPDGKFFEHEFVLDVAKRIGAILEAHGVAVAYTRKGGEKVSLASRCVIANAIKDLDLFVSLHTNAAAGTGWSSAVGWEAYVYGLSGDRHKAAQAILARVEDVAHALRSPAIKAYPELYVLKHTDAPAVLIEHGFHTNKEEAALMATKSYRENLAQAEAYGILDYLGIAVKATETPQESAEKSVTVSLPQLQNGSHGASVLALQQLLAAKGADPGRADGIFGGDTEKALQTYQRAAKLTADGICGKDTWTALLTK